MVKHSQVLKKAILQCLYNIPKKVRDEVDLFDAEKHQNFLTVDFNTLGIKVFYNVIGVIMKSWRTWLWEWSIILKVLKVKSLLCLYNISKKKLWMEFSIFWCKLLIFDLNFSKILRKSIATTFVCYCDTKHSVTSLVHSGLVLLVFGWLWSKMSVAF